MEEEYPMRVPMPDGTVYYLVPEKDGRLDLKLVKSLQEHHAKFPVSSPPSKPLP